MRLSITSTSLAVALLVASPGAHGGQPQTEAGLDVVVRDTEARAGGTVSVPVLFVPADDDHSAGGADEIASLQFSLDFSGLSFDTTDSNLDGVPDAIEQNPDGHAGLDAFSLIIANGDTIADDQRLDLVVTDPARRNALPAATLLRITFGVDAATPPGDIPLTLSNVLARDTGNSLQPIDEAVSGAVTVTSEPAPSATPTASARPTPTATAPRRSPTPTALKPTPTLRPTRTAAPATAAPGTPPPGYDLTATGEDGGCAVGSQRPSPAFALSLIAALLGLCGRRARR